jgi:hypothetical protein
VRPITRFVENTGLIAAFTVLQESFMECKGRAMGRAGIVASPAANAIGIPQLQEIP